jgi:PKD repeat protein
MAPIVAASFISTVISSTLPITVQFSDTTIVTSGVARQWLWDFGDGEISTDQNPLHIYANSPKSSFTVTLTVLATTTEVTSITSSDLDGTRISNTRLTGVDFTIEDAWAARASAPQDDQLAYHHVNWNGVQYFYFTNDPQLLLETVLGGEPLVYLMMKMSTGSINTIHGTVNAIGVSTAPVTTTEWEVHSLLEGISSTNPITATVKVKPEAQISYTIGEGTKGIKVALRTRSFPDGPDQSHGNATGQIGNPSIDFVGTPLSGTSPLAVQFTDLSSVNHAYSLWDFGDGNIATFVGETHPLNTYTTDGCSLDLL